MDQNSTSASLENWEKESFKQLLFATLKEQRLNRRWKTFFRLITLFFILAFLVSFFGIFDNVEPTSHAHTALIDIDGLIVDDKPANADNIIASLKDAFEERHAKGVILRINSPGGSPVQVANISNEIKRLHKLHPKKKIYAVCSDICASGGYWVAAAADTIYANPASLIGSIGVVMEGFGFADIMKKIGIERRLITAGKHKGLLDAFSPLKADEVTFAQRLLDQVHQQFIHYIKAQRGNRLKISEDTFSGLAWTGEDALRMGLIDGFGSEEDVARDIIKEDNIIDYTIKPNYFERIAGQFGSTLTSTVTEQLSKINIH